MTFPEEAPCWDSDPDEEPGRSALDEGGPVPDFAAALRNLDAAVLPPTTHAPALGINGPAPADEPVPVPPPVDALLEHARDPLVDALTELIDDEAFCPNCDSGVLRARDMAKIKDGIEAVWAAGVAEGRRLLDETAATAAVHAYELGIAEGRRQAAHAITEETATFCMDGVGRHLVEVCTKLAAGKQADHG